MRRSVDIIFTIAGCRNPPRLPLREELNSNGFEIVYNANKIIHDAGEAKEKKERLLRQAKEIESKLERKKLNMNSQLKSEAIVSIRRIITRLEDIIKAIENDTFPKQRMLQYSNAEYKYNDLIGSNNCNGARCTSEMGFQSHFEVTDILNLTVTNNEEEDIEKDIARVLARISESEFFSSDENEEDTTYDSGNVDDLVSSENNNLSSIKCPNGNVNKYGHDQSPGGEREAFDLDYNEDSDSDVDHTVCSLKWEGVKVDSTFPRLEHKHATSGIKSITYYYTPQDSDGQTQTRKILFCDQEPTVEEAVAKCKQLTEQLQIMQFSLSDDHGDESFSDDRNEDDINDSSDLKWHKFDIDSSYIEKRVKAIPSTISYYYSSPEQQGSSRSKSVRFKDVKPTAEEAIAKCRALTEQVKVMQMSVSSDTNSEASLTTREDNESDRTSLVSTGSSMHERNNSKHGRNEEYNNRTAGPFESVIFDVPLTKCRLMAEKRSEFRSNMKKAGGNQDGIQILYHGLQKSRSYEPI